MVTRNCPRMLIVFLMLSIGVSSCSQGSAGHSSVYAYGIGFQYDLPSDYCHIIEPASGTVEIYCTEGKVMIQILTSESGSVSDPLISKTLKDMQVPLDVYSIGIEKSKVGQDGGYRDIQAATIISLENIDLEHNEYPYYVAVSNFGKNKIFVAKGYLYNEQFALKFSDIFLRVVKSFEPFSPP